MVVSHPYRQRPKSAFWADSISGTPFERLDLFVPEGFVLTAADRIATAGSCFAGRLAPMLGAMGLSTVAAEPPSVFAARYGNIYTTRQLRQLVQRAYGLVAPHHVAWRRDDGRFVDPFRTREFPDGFATPEAVAVATERHLCAVREVFESCTVFVFTLGLTEAWLCDTDGMAVPLPPGVVAAPEDPTLTVSPRNLRTGEMIQDLHAAFDDLRRVNRHLRIILTVSPVPMAATFTPQHVLVANAYCKSALRAVAQEVADDRPDTVYFPSYEMVASHPAARLYASDLRQVTPDGVAAVIDLFRRIFVQGPAGRGANGQPPHAAFISTAAPSHAPTSAALEANGLSAAAVTEADRLIRDAGEIVCDEDMLARTAPR